MGRISIVIFDWAAKGQRMQKFPAPPQLETILQKKNRFG